MVRKLVARDHQQAYDFWATHFDDPALMANRDSETTRRKLEALVRQLPWTPESEVLDVGPGDGALFRLISAPGPPLLRRRSERGPRSRSSGGRSRACPTWSSRSGRQTRFPIPTPGSTSWCINSVLQMLPSISAIQSSLVELIRVCRPGGIIFVGELPFRSELDRGILVHTLRKLREFGARSLLRTLYHVYARPLLRGEPVVLYPASNLHIPQQEFEALCGRLGLGVECRRHHELRRPSSTRNDYLLRLAGR